MAMKFSQDHTHGSNRKSEPRDPRAVIRCRLISGFFKGTAVGLAIGLLLILISHLISGADPSPSRILFFSTCWCGISGYLAALAGLLLRHS